MWVAQEWILGSCKDSWILLSFMYVYTSRYHQNHNFCVLIIVWYFRFIKLDACMSWFYFQIEEIRQQTKAEKKRLAMAMRQKQLGALGMKVRSEGRMDGELGVMLLHKVGLLWTCDYIEQEGVTHCKSSIIYCNQHDWGRCGSNRHQLSRTTVNARIYK